MITHLYNIPLEVWVGRMMKCDSQKKGAGTLSRNPVKVLAFDADKGTATVHPSGHKRTDLVKINQLLPWWSRNDDLRQKYHIHTSPQADFNEILDLSAAFLRDDRLERQAASTPPLASTQIFISAPPPTLPPTPPAATMQTTLASIRRIIVDPHASSAWMEDYALLMATMQDCEEAQINVTAANAKLEHARHEVEVFAQSLASSGITIEWNTPEAPKEAEKPAPVVVTKPARGERIPSELDAKRVSHFRSTLASRMTSGHCYTRDELLAMRGQQNTATFKKILGFTFTNHPHLKAKRFRNQPTLYCYKL